MTMDAVKLDIDRAEAARLYREYKEHRHYSAPADAEIKQAYRALSKGQLVIQAIESVVRAGLNREGLPVLALCRADAPECFLRVGNGNVEFRPSAGNWRAPAGTISVPFDRLPCRPQRWGEHKSILPAIPHHLRPKHALSNYHLLWEATWEPIPTRDPYLLRRIGSTDMWLVAAMWDLTEVERAALATRIKAT
jgi:hypothetical protein